MIEFLNIGRKDIDHEMFKKLNRDQMTKILKTTMGYTHMSQYETSKEYIKN